MEEGEDTSPWRTLVAALFATGVLGAVIWAGWGVLDEQLGQGGAASPDAAVDRFLVAVNDGQSEGLRDEALGEPEVFFDALDSALAPLSAQSVAVVSEEITVDGARADAVIEWSVAGGAAAGATWNAALRLERRRGEWQPVLDATTIHPQLRANWTLEVLEDSTVRRTIQDVDGTPLTSAGSSVVVGIEPRRVVDENRLLNAWAGTLPESYEVLEELLGRGGLRPTWFYPVATLSPARFGDVWPRLRAIPGVIRREGQDTSASSSFAIHVLGRVGEPTAEMVEDGAAEGEAVGLYGLEAAFEDRLEGGRTVEVVVREADRDVHDVVTTLTDSGAEPVVTTLRTRTQQAVEDALLGREDDLVAVVVVDSADGAIRATASRPVDGFNRAFEGRYTPGDAVLPVVVDALVDAGVGMGTTVACPAEDVVAGAQLTAPRPDDDTTVAAALGAGCDTTIGALALDLEDELGAAAQRLGFGRTIDLPLPTADTSWPEPRDPTERVRAAVGQAQVLTSPLHVASMLAGAVSGAWRPPSLLVDQGATSGTELATGTGGAMAEVLGEGVALSDAVRVVGGTAERPLDGDRVTDAWALGVQDDLAVVVLVEEAGGPTPARDVLASVMQELAGEDATEEA